jgi:transposase-like protein
LANIDKKETQRLAAFPAGEGQALLPLLSLVEQSQLAEQELRRFDDINLLILYLDGLRFGAHHVIDGSGALRAAIDRVYGAENPVRRRRNHKVKNVMDHLPEELKDPVKATMKATWRLAPKEGIARLRKQARWLQVEHPDAAASLLEGLEEIFTVNRLALPPGLRRCLVSTNLIESPCSGVRMRTRRVSRWRDGVMVKRWAASSFLATEKNYPPPGRLPGPVDPESRSG